MGADLRLVPQTSSVSDRFQALEKRDISEGEGLYNTALGASNLALQILAKSVQANSIFMTYDATEMMPNKELRLTFST